MIMPFAELKNSTRRQSVSTASAHAPNDEQHKSAPPPPLLKSRAVMSSARYLVLSGIGSLLTFQAVWWAVSVYSADEAPWIAASVATGVALMGCMVGREIRVRTVYKRGRGFNLNASTRNYQSKKRLGYTATLAAATSALRKLERRLREIERNATTPHEHLEAYRLCEQYLSSAEETLPTLGLGTEVRAAVRAGQERVGKLKYRHLLLWARKESQAKLALAQQCVRPEDQIEIAQQALTAIKEALKVYPQDRELEDSAQAMREYIARAALARWIGLAERAEFKQQFAEASDFYRNALFDLSRADISEDVRAQAAELIRKRLQKLSLNPETNLRVNRFGAEDLPLNET